MSFFLSSPPQPTYQKPHLQSSFFTPQAHRTSFFSDTVPISWPSLQFQPKSPSPLRPSWNAGNVMRRQVHGTLKGTGDGYQTESEGESGGWENARDTGFSPFAAGTDTAHGTSDSQLPSNPAIITTTPSLFTSQPQPTQTEPTNPPPRNPFTYQSQSHQSHPPTQLTSRLRQTRDARRSLFLDRLRSSRRDERDNNIIEKFEKEEYWRERRRREERMAGAQEAVVRIDWEDEDVGFDGEEEGLSPVDEEREVGELVEGWLGGQSQSRNQNQNQNQRELDGNREQERNREDEDDFMDADLDFEDSDVEEVFMQVLSQQEQQERQQQPLSHETLVRVTHGDGYGGTQEKDAEMS